MYVTVVGISNFLSAEHPLKALSPNVVQPDEISKFVRLAQPVYLLLVDYQYFTL